MNIKRVLAGLSATALAASLMATTAFADEPTVYGVAGVSFQVKDSWDHRDAVGEELKDEKGEKVLDATCYDVNITGNGEYEVSLVDWWTGMNTGFEESEMGWVSLSTTIPVTKDDDGNYIFADYPDAKLVINSYTEDGVTYEFGEEDILAEDGGGGLGAWKIVNAWGDFDARGEDFGCVTWQTTDPVVIKFTVSGLPTDKAEDYEDEVIEFISGNGAGEVADEPTDTPDDESSEVGEPADDPADDEEPVVDDSAITGDEEADSTDSEETSSEASSSTAEEDEESSSKLPLILGIGGGVVAVAAIAAIVIKVKR